MVGLILQKILSMLLNTRGNQWSEAHSTRAVGQFGFRKGRSTLDTLAVSTEARKRRERGDVTYSAKQCRDQTAPEQLLSFITKGPGVEGLGNILLNLVQE